MELIHVWALASALGLTALAATLKTVEYRHELKLSNDIVSSLRKELDALQQQHNKSISNNQQFNAAEKEEFVKRISDLEEQLKLHHAKLLNYPSLGGGFTNP